MSDERSADQIEAQQRYNEIVNDKSGPYHVPGPKTQKVVDEVLALSRRIHGARNDVNFIIREDGDPPMAPPPPAPLELDAPVLTGGARWEPGLTQEVHATFARAGLSRYAAHAFLGDLAEQHNQGMLGKWTPETALAELERKYGAAQADEYIAAAEQAGADLPKALRAWLARTGGHANPTLIVRLADLWRRSTHATRRPQA